jgi:hypothetical protein
MKLRGSHHEPDATTTIATGSDLQRCPFGSAARAEEVVNMDYQIRVKGQLDPILATWFEGFTLTHTPDGDTLLTGSADQAALHGVFARCRDLGVMLISVNPTTKTNGSHNKENAMSNWLHVEMSHIIDASPEQLYAIVRDYHVGHPAILPKEYFTKGLTVEQGGVGAGTVIRTSVTMWGNEYPFRSIVSEPEPGRLLVETDTETGQYTNFVFEPLNGGRQTRVTFASEFPVVKGLMGVIQRLSMPSIVRKMYIKELHNLAEYVQVQAPVR